MPLAVTGRIRDAVVSAPATSNWQDGDEKFLLTLTAERSRIEKHIAILEDRLHGRLRWTELLSGATLSNGRPMPVSRRYAEMLVTEERLPLYDAGTLRISLDLHNPGNEAGVPQYDPQQIELAIVTDEGYYSALAPGSVFPAELGFAEQARRRAAHGAFLGQCAA